MTGQMAFPWGKVAPKGPDEGNTQGLGAVAWESSSHRLAAMPASPIPFVPSGHFPLIRGIGLSQGGLSVQDISPPCERGDTAEGGGWIPFPRPVIARRGKAPTWQSVPSSPLPPPLGEVPPQGAERVSPAKKKSPGGGDWGLTFFHIMLY